MHKRMLDLGMDQKFLRIYDLIKGDDFIIFFFPYLSHQNKFLCETFFFFVFVLESKHIKCQHKHKFDPI